MTGNQGQVGPDHAVGVYRRFTYADTVAFQIRLRRFFLTALPYRTGKSVTEKQRPRRRGPREIIRSGQLSVTD